MEHKDLAGFHKALDRMDLENPDVALISGADIEAADAVLERIRKRLVKEIGQYETVIFSAEPGEDARLQAEIFNIPLFSPYRLLIVRQAEEVLKAALASKGRYAQLEQDFQHLPGRTLIVLVYDGNPPQKLIKLFRGRLIQLSTRELYGNQALDALRSAAKRLHLHLSEDALHALRESVEPRHGAIESALTRLRDMQAHPEDPIGVEQVREALFPAQGANSFALVDALFQLDHEGVRRELLKFNPAVDSYFGLLKLILNRTDEIRRAAIAARMGMADSELIDFLDLKNRPPFIQKKIAARLKSEINRFNAEDLDRIYDFLIEIQKDFRSGAPLHRQGLVFQERILETFFAHSGAH